MRLQITTLSGALLSDFLADGNSKVGDIATRVETLSPLQKGCKYQLCLEGNVLSDSSSLDDNGVIDGADLCAVLVKDPVLELVEQCAEGVETPGSSTWMDAARQLRKRGRYAAPYAAEIADIAENGGPAIRFHLVMALGDLGPKAAPQIARFLHDKSPIVRDAAAQSMGKMGTAVSLPLLLNADCRIPTLLYTIFHSCSSVARHDNDCETRQ